MKIFWNYIVVKFVPYCKYTHATEFYTLVKMVDFMCILA